MVQKYTLESWNRLKLPPEVRDALDRVDAWYRSNRFTAHTPECFVYRYAQALLGRDRQGLCDCGAEQTNTANLRKWMEQKT